MPANMLVMAVDNSRPKGAIVDVRETDIPWGTKETLPTFVRVTVSDATVEQVSAYLEQWQQVFDFEILADHPLRYDVRISVNPNAITAFGIDAGVREEMWLWMQEVYSATLLDASGAPTSYDIRLPKPIDLVEARAALYDNFGSYFRDRYLFDSTAVDQAVAAGGEVTRTAAQLLAVMVDRLA